MEFLANKYTKWYFNIVTNASKRLSNGYVEKHHIIPKSLGGLVGKSNLVKLTAREHFICHMLLVKMTDGKSKKKMHWALHKMMYSTNQHQVRYIPNSRTFDRVRTDFCNMLRAPRIITELHRQNIIAANRKKKGAKRSEEIRKNMCISKKKRDERIGGPNKGKKFSEEVRKHMSEGQKNRTDVRIISAETRKKISEANTGHISPNKGKKLSKLARDNMSKAHKNSTKLYTCKFCSTQSKSHSNIIRWHDNNCKFAFGSP